MIELRTNTATRIAIGPFLDKTDGVTPETSLTVTNCKLTMTVDDGGVPTLVLDTNPTASGGANDMVHITGDDAGLYDLEIAAANVNYLGRGKICITDAANHCPVWVDIAIITAVEWDRKYATSGGNLPNAVAGASGGALIAGSNAGTTTFAALTITGQFLISDGVAINAATSNRVALAIAGNGSGAGARLTGGATGQGLKLIGGGTSGDGLGVTTTNGHGFNVAATGASKHGATFTGGNSGTSHGVVFAAGTGGVDLYATLRTGLKKNQAFANFHFQMTDSTTHAPATGATVSVERLIDGGSFGAGSLSSVTEVAHGIYRVDFAAADLNGNIITFRATADDCDNLNLTLITEP